METLASSIENNKRINLKTEKLVEMKVEFVRQLIVVSELKALCMELKTNLEERT